LSNASGRFEKETRFHDDDGWDLSEDLPPLRTQVTREPAKTIITRNDSPDISFDRSINPYRGCEHGVSIVSRDRPMPISACRLGSILRQGCFEDQCGKPA